MTLRTVGRVVAPKTTTTSTGTVLPKEGFHVFNSTAAGVYFLETPVAGSRKYFFQSTATSSALKTVVVQSSAAGSTAVFLGSANTTLTFSAAGQALELFAPSSIRWEILSNTGSVDSS